MAKLSIIIPCYYNELNIPVTSQELIANEQNFELVTEFEYILVDDGSKDNTYQELIKFKNQYPAKVKVIKLSGNFGSYNAILAGMKYATGNCCVVCPADLQDPIDLIPKMMNYWEKGVKLVIGNRQDRKDPFLSKLLASIFQYLMRKFALKELPKGGFDFVLFDQQIKEEIVRMDEKNSNSLYLMLYLKYDYVNIPYTRKKREIGRSRWTFKKKLKLFIDSFVAFSYLPIRMITVLGLVLGGTSILYAFYILYQRFSGNIEVEGWTTMMIVLLFVSSFQMIALGVLGEYLWRTLDASRKRPNYVIENIV
jgi:dolichol-phosphate mannosyltransferase